jgi:hypothetical protein
MKLDELNPPSPPEPPPAWRALLEQFWQQCDDHDRIDMQVMLKMGDGAGANRLLESWHAALAEKSRRRSKKPRQKRKFKYGSFGGWFYPGYHYDAQDTSSAGSADGVDGSGGESVQENQEQSQQQIIQRFAKSCCDFLGIENAPIIKLRRDPVWSQRNGTFGRYTSGDVPTIELAVADRHIVDILRTLAHEMTHARQNEHTGLPDYAGETGSEFENEANARAGEIMRHWAEQEPDIFKDVGLEEDWKKTAGAMAAAACIAGTPGCATTAKDALKTVQTVGRAANTVKDMGRAGAEEELRQRVKDALRRQRGEVVPEGVTESSGYIPTAAEKNDPRYSMALTVDVQPGETGRQANKLGLKTDSQGRPALLMKKLENLLESVKQGEDIGVFDRNNKKSNFVWSDYNELPTSSIMDLAEAHFLKNSNLLESNSPETKKYFQGLFSMGTTPEIDSTYLVTLLILIDDQVSVAQNPVIVRMVDRRGPNEYTVEMPDGRLIKFPYQVLRDRAIYNTWFFDDTSQYDKFRSAVSLKFDVDLPGNMISESAITQDEDLFEVKMSPGELQKWAASEEAQGIRAGFEAELIFRDTGREDEQESEPDYDQDERARDIESVVDFFQGGENGIGRNQANRLRDDLYEQFHEWVSNTFYEDVWDQDKYMEWVDDQIWRNEKDEWRERAAKALELDIEGELSPEQTEEIEKTAQQMFQEEAEEQWESQGPWYSQAEEGMMDEFRDNNDEGEWLDSNYRYMSDIENEFNLDWPYWTEGSDREGGSRDPEDIADSLARNLGVRVVASSNYHSTRRRPDLWIIEPDGSLDPDDYEDTGLEIVSPPMPLPEALQKLREVMDWANDSNEGNAYTNSSTGLHMGISIPHKGGDVTM